MSGKFDAIDRVLLSFEDVDPVERVKEAMASGNHRAASEMIDRLDEAQLAKLAESIPGMETKDSSGTSTSAENLNASSEPKPTTPTAESVKAEEKEPKNKAGDEKVEDKGGDTSVATEINADHKVAMVNGIKRALRTVAEASLRKEASLRGRATQQDIDARACQLADLLLSKK